MFEDLQEMISRNRRSTFRRMMPMRRRRSGRFSARWLMIGAAIAVPVVLLIRRMRQNMQKDWEMQGMVPATGAQLERSHFVESSTEMTETGMENFENKSREDVDTKAEMGFQKESTTTSYPEPTMVQSQPATPPMASEDSPVEVAGPHGLKRAEAEKEQKDTSAFKDQEAYVEPGQARNNFLPEAQSTIQPGEPTAPDKQVEMQAPPEIGDTQLDDFRVIEGIGPGITMILHRAGIATYQQLSETPLERLQELMSEANISQITDPTMWPEQAVLAARGDWKALDDLQSQIRAGRRVE